MIYGGTNQGLGDLSVDDGYSSIGVLVGRQLDDDNLDDGFAFFDVRGHIENNGAYGFNTHFGYRWLDEEDGTADEDQWVYGLNAGFDGREYEGEWFYWCRVGVEALGYDWEFRANGYLDCVDSQDLALEAVGFEENALLIETLERRAMWGIDASVSRRLDFSDTIDITGSLTGYHFDSDGFESATGGRIAIDIAYGDNINIGGRASWDTLFDFNALVSLTLRLNTPPEANRSGPDVRQRLVRPVVRQELVVIDEQQVDRRSFTDPANGGADVPFYHVDNTFDANGAGTFEDRFQSLEEAEAGTSPGDVIVVHEGDGTTNFYDTGYELQEDQITFGAGYSGGIDIVGVELWYLADKVGITGKPTLTNPDGNVVTLADGNTVAFFNIVDAGSGLTEFPAPANGIFGQDITDVTILDNLITDSQGSGIFINGFSGTALVQSNEAYRNLGAANPGADGGGMHILNAEGSVAFNENICNDNGNRSGDANTTDCIELTSNATGDLFGLFYWNHIENNFGDGIELHHTGSGTYTALLDWNHINDNTESAVIVSHDIDATGSFDLTIRDNELSRNGYDGIELGKFLNSGRLTAVIDGNVIDDNGSMANFLFREAGVHFDIRSNVADITFTNNTVTNSFGPGVSAVVGPQSNEPNPPDAHLLLNVADNIITGNGFGRTDDYVDGIFLWATSADTDFNGNSVPDRIGRIDAAIENNFIDSNNGFGINANTTLAIVSNTPPPPDPILCTRIVGNTGSDDYRLNQNGGLTFTGPFLRPGGGIMIGDVATGGNTGTITTIGAITPGVCQVP